MESSPERTWIAPDPVVHRLALDDRSWVDVVGGLVTRADEVEADLRDVVTWSQGRVFRYERWIDEPRLTAWQPSHAAHPALREVQRWIMRRYRVSFEGTALSWYRDERDGVGFHRDRELRYLEDTLIGVLTLGAQRPFLMRPLTGQRAEAGDMTDVIDLRPAAGDLLVMGGRCQAAWLHAVPQTRGRCGGRLSAQWRWTSRRGRRDPNPTFSAPRHFSRR